MFASKRSIKKAQKNGLGISINPNENVKKAHELGYDINPAYVISPEKKTKLNKTQKKHKALRTSKKSKMYNLLHS